MKPFATLGSEISKVRDRVASRLRAESLRPAKVAGDVREQRDRLLAKLGEQTFRLIAERKLVVPKMLQESVERLAALLGVQLPVVSGGQSKPPTDPAPPLRDQIVEGIAAVASDPLLGDEELDAPVEPTAAARTKAVAPSPGASAKKPKKNGGKRRGKR
ncbi:MAG: hypothetical protein ABI175_28995 [Polyangiales bacterium]